MWVDLLNTLNNFIEVLIKVHASVSALLGTREKNRPSEKTENVDVLGPDPRPPFSEKRAG